MECGLATTLATRSVNDGKYVPDKQTGNFACSPASRGNLAKKPRVAAYQQMAHQQNQHL